MKKIIYDPWMFKNDVLIALSYLRGKNYLEAERYLCSILEGINCQKIYELENKFELNEEEK